VLSEDLAIWQILTTASVIFAFTFYKYQLLEKEKYLSRAIDADVLERIQSLIIVTDLKGVVTSFNSGAQKLLGYSSKEIVGESIARIYSEQEYKILTRNIEIVKELGSYQAEASLLKSSNKSADVELIVSELRNEKGICYGYVCYANDVSERKKMEEELHIQKDILSHLAHHDVLTGLPNRTLFQDRLDHAILRATRSKSDLALLFLDLDELSL